MPKNGNVAVLVAGLLGAAKLVAQAYGYDIITDDQINAIANGASAIAAIVAAVLNNRKEVVD